MLCWRSSIWFLLAFFSSVILFSKYVCTASSLDMQSSKKSSVALLSHMELSQNGLYHRTRGPVLCWVCQLLPEVYQSLPPPHLCPVPPHQEECWMGMGRVGAGCVGDPSKIRPYSSLTGLLISLFSLTAFSSRKPKNKRKAE